MGTGWQLAAFPLILPWRREFWTLPAYFPDLKVGVLLHWPAGLPYQGLPLPPEALAARQDWQSYQPGELRQWQAFAEYQAQQMQEGTGDILKALRGEPPEPPQPPPPPPSAEAWSLAWQLEKMQADEEAQMLRVDQGDAWLAEILAPEPWEQKVEFGVVTGVPEMVDPDLARMRYRLWDRVIGPQLLGRWAPLLLGRSARAIFQALRDRPQWPLAPPVRVSLPGCRSEGELAAVLGETGRPGWLEELQALLEEVLEAGAASGDLKAVVVEFNRFVAAKVAPGWPSEPVWHWDLEVWGPDPEDEAGSGPVLCWAGAESGILPG